MGRVVGVSLAAQLMDLDEESGYWGPVEREERSHAVRPGHKPLTQALQGGQRRLLDGNGRSARQKRKR